TVSFAANASTATVTIDPTAETTPEFDETVILTLAANGTPATTGGYSVGTPSAATGTLLADDTTVSVAVSPASVAEDGSTNLVYTFTRVGNTTPALTVNFSVAGTAVFTANASTDFAQTGASAFDTTSGTVVIPAGSASATVTLDPQVDSVVEQDETAILTVTAGTGYAPASPTAATGTILNDDTEVKVELLAANSVNEDGTTNLVYTFTRTGVTNNTLTVNFIVSGAASPTTDYVATGAATFDTGTGLGTVLFGVGATTKTVTFDPTADNVVEGDESAGITVDVGAGYNVALPNSASGIISNDDSTVTVTVSPASQPEDGAGTLVYTFTRSGFTANALSVIYQASGTATGFG